MQNKLERNPNSLIQYMIQNLCSIFNGNIYNHEEHGEILEETIDMLNEIYDKLDCFWNDEEKIPVIIDIIAKYNSIDGSEMGKRAFDAWFRK